VSRTVCPYCERRCALDEGDVGYCRMYVALDREIAERYPRRYSSLHVNHIESVPFFHYQPGSRTLVIGGAGCNLDCRYCSNAHLARSEPGPLLAYELSPERILRLVRQYGCHNLAFAVNEPTVALPTLFELADAARREGMSDGFYAAYTGVASAEPVRRTIGILSGLTHLEVSTPIIQGLNDGDIPAIARFLHELDPMIPWHVFRLLPEYKMADAERPNIAVVNQALEEARGRLPFIYFSNFVGSRWVNTHCPSCSALAVERLNLSGCASKAVGYALADNRCAACGADLGIRGAPVTWHSEDGPAWQTA
jgi:pyruvate formate lyase activating enzyme